MKSLTIGTKFRGGFLALFAVTLILGISSVLALRAMNESFDAAVQKTARKLQLFAKIYSTAADMDISLRGVALATFIKNGEGAADQNRRFQTLTANLKATLEETAPLVSVPEGKRLFPILQADFDKWLGLYPEFLRLCQSGDPAKATQYGFANFPPVLGEFASTSARLVVVYQEVLASNVAEAENQYSRNLWIVVGLLCASLLIGAGIFLVTGQVNKDLRRVVGELTSGGEQVASASRQIAATSQTLSQGASEQAASIEEVSASMEEMTAMTKRNADNSAQATAMMAETVKQVDHSNSALADMVASMSSIKVSSEKVAKINKTIDEIAFQTNILALNAAVEAARAGEAGMGFAVVADEVRNLAQRSAVAAKDTAELIEESIANATQGAQRLDLVSVAIRGITDGAGKVKNLLDEVNESSKQQGQGIQQVSTAISQVSTVTQTAAASAEETAAASEELNAQSETVRDVVHSLALMVEGGSETGRPEVRPSSKRRRPFVTGGSKFHAAPPKGGDPFPMEPVEPGSFREF